MSSAFDIAANLMTPEEEEVLRLFETLILQRTLEARKRAIEVLAKYITIAYYTGAEKAINQLNLPIRPTSIGVTGLDTVINELAPVLEETFGFLAKDLTDIIEDGIKNNWTYEQVKQELQRNLKTFGSRINFRRAGQYKEVVKVYPSGRLRLVRKKIQRNITMRTDAYANLLARTAVKKALRSWTY